jgi:hypothetical protein
MNKIFNKRVLIVLALIGIICIAFSTTVFATNTIGGSTPTGSGSATGLNPDIWGQGQNFINSGNATIDFQTVWTDLKPIAQIIMGIGLVVLVCVGSVLGVKYMIAGADDKAKVKQKLIWFCVAAALVVGATAVFNIVVEVASKLEG